MCISEYSLVVKHIYQGPHEDNPTASLHYRFQSISHNIIPVISSTVSIHYMYSDGERRAMLFNKADQRQCLGGVATTHILCTTAACFVCDMSHCGMRELISSIR